MQSPPPLIQAGHIVLIRLPSGEIKNVSLTKDSNISLGKFGSFDSNALIGQPYGLSYEIIGKNLKVLPPKTIQELEDTDATNEMINDAEHVQPLTLADIEELKDSGIHASEIIEKQIEQHANFALKTEYSKDKYKKRKEAKYSKTFTTIVPNLSNICDFWYNKDPNRIRDIRPDTLSQMLNLANIRPGGRYIAVEEASGMVVSSILARMGGQGRLLTICDVDSPPAYPIMSYLNFEKDAIHPVLSSLNWATADENHTPIVPPVEPTSGEFKSERHKSRKNKRKNANDLLFSTRADLFAGEFEALIIASEYEPMSILEKLSPYLAGSASIVVQSPHVQVLSDLQGKMRRMPQYLGPSVTESWLRRYQVLPGRTHPTMSTSGTGGFLLHAIKVYDDPNASSVHFQRHKNGTGDAKDVGEDDIAGTYGD
ncbi:Gcd10p-domain-containing protein [Rickenella mellea]|uniref:tRNA (adenine(58)-N(1))-methyltransferase non-catalytic subunit TRM6 n=1 Tax=Rickenella mellea TaxID=50990 RepID=A0A4Y7QM21_9AGAM|nr:Gcd10p-domain-containing protein [Rickenella mellea]